MKSVECEVWLLVDEGGNYVASASADALSDLYDEQVGEGSCVSRRCVCLKVKVPIEAYVTLTGTAPPEGEASLEFAGWNHV